MSKKINIEYDVLYDLYIVNKLSIKNISKILNHGNSVVSRELKDNNLFYLKSSEIKKSKTRIYKIYQQMKQRCTNKNHIKYSIYGCKGVSYCEDWNTFEGFFKDMHVGYFENLTLDRIDSNKHYCKENCRWVDYKTQNNNKSDNIGINIIELSERVGISKSALYSRIKNGWSMDKILDTKKSTYNGRENKEAI